MNHCPLASAVKSVSSIARARHSAYNHLLIIVAFSLPLRAFPVMELRRSAWNQLRIIAAAAAARRRFRTASQIRAW